MRKRIEEIFIRVIRCIAIYTLKKYIAYRRKDYVYNPCDGDTDDVLRLEFALIELESEYSKPISKIKSKSKSKNKSNSKKVIIKFSTVK